MYTIARIKAQDPFQERCYRYGDNQEKQNGLCEEPAQIRENGDGETGRQGTAQENCRRIQLVTPEDVTYTCSVKETGSPHDAENGS